jgi:hypothetical protein
MDPSRVRAINAQLSDAPAAAEDAEQTDEEIKA